MPQETTPHPILRTIPDPQTVRNHLGRTLRETRLLRRLLRLAQAVDSARLDERRGVRDER